MSIFKECTLYDGRGKIMLNLSMAQSVQPTDFKDAKAIVTFHNSVTDPNTYYVTDTYEELRYSMENGSLLY